MKQKKTVVTLADGSAAYNFSVGQPVKLVMNDDGSLRKRTFRDRIKMLQQRLLWWRVIKYEVTKVTPKLGLIEIQPLRWSWRRWKWVP